MLSISKPIPSVMRKLKFSNEFLIIYKYISMCSAYMSVDCRKFFLFSIMNWIISFIDSIYYGVYFDSSLNGYHYDKLEIILLAEAPLIVSTIMTTPDSNLSKDDKLSVSTFFISSVYFRKLNLDFAQLSIASMHFFVKDECCKFSRDMKT